MAENLPLFPLGAVLLPGASLPLHIFEPRYRQLTVDLVTGAVPERSFGVIATKQGGTGDSADIEPIHDIGCTAVLREARRLPDGRFDIVTRGDRRFRLLDIDDTASCPYLMGSVEWIPDDEPADEQRMLLPMLAKSAREAHKQYCSAAWRDEDWNEPEASVEFAALPHLLASDCLLTLEDRQVLLEERNPVHRLRLIRTLLLREAGFLQQLRAVPRPLSEFGIETTRN
ncbi:MAG: peptidase [Pseudonocardiaceae bacterium]|nr:peptidase [Pseudonocardiaceae bacterium]